MRLTEIFRTRIFTWLLPSRDLVDLTKHAVKAGLALNPGFSISRDRAVWTAVCDDPTFLTSLELVFEGLRKAGVPEQ